MYLADTLRELNDQLAVLIFNWTPKEAHEAGVCIKCREVPDFATQAESREYLITGLCGACWREIVEENDPNE